MKRCRCCRSSWPEEFFTVCRPDGLRRSTCNACRKGCGTDARRRRHADVALKSWHRRQAVPSEVRRRIVLGPVPCQGCREAVTWNGYAWENAAGNRHSCDNAQVGISDAIPDIMCDALLVADTSREGVSRLEVSAP